MERIKRALSIPRPVSCIVLNEAMHPQMQMQSVDFESAALAYAKPLLQTARCLLSGGADAEDVVQETYLQAWKSLDKFTPGTNMRAWLFAILLNVVRKHRRKWTFRMKLSGSSDELEPITGFAPASQLADQEVLSALKQISKDYAQILLLADVHEFSYKEIAEILDVPIGTVMSRLSRARQQLRTHLTPRQARHNAYN